MPLDLIFCNTYQNTFTALYWTPQLTFMTELHEWVSTLTNSCPDKDPESVFRSHLLMSEPKGFPASAGFLPLLVWEWRSNRNLSLPLSQSLGETQLSKKDLYPSFTLPHPRPVLSCDPALKRVQVKNTQLGWTSAETDLLSVSQGVSKRTPSFLNQTAWLN